MGIFTSILDLSRYMPVVERIFIDIPIGLKRHDREERCCDQMARACLKPHRHASVFAAPTRCALGYEDYNQANEANRSCSGRGLSRQTFNIMKKIKEVDDFLKKEPQRHKLMEFHPEVGFWALNNRQAMRYNKKTQQGFEERLALLVRHYPGAGEIIDQAISRYLRKQVLRDDIVDALLCAVASRHGDNYYSLPDLPPKDEEGRPMQIVYWQP